MDIIYKSSKKVWEITSESELKEVWNMKKKIICLMTSVILCLSLLTGCQLGSRTSSVPEEEGSVTAYAIDVHPEDYQVSYYYAVTEKNFLEKYNAAVDESRQINIQYFPDTESMNRQLSTEILSGGGPDLFLFRDTTMPQYQTYANRGVFSDLNPFLERNGYESRQFQQVVYDYGLVGEERRFIPIEYGVPICITNQEMAENYRLEEIDDRLNYQDYYELLEKTNTLGKDASISGKTFKMFWFSDVDSIRYRLLPGFINQETKEGMFLQPEFEQAISNYSEMVSNQGGFDAFESAYIHPSMSLIALQDRALLFDYDPVSSQSRIYMKMDMYLENSQNSSLLLYPMKEFNKEDYSAYVGKMMAINENSSRKYKTWEVIEYALSASVQATAMIPSGPITGNAVTIEGQNRNKNEWLNSGNTIAQKSRKDFVNQYYEIINSVTKCDCLTYNPIYVQEVFDPLYLEYESGTKTLDEFIKELQNKTGLYLKEQN